jgi:DNA repair protein RadD
MEYVLRPYQIEASNKAIGFFCSKKKQNAIMVLPTGSGKSLIIADIASKLDGHLLIFQPSKEILEQNFAKLQSYGVLDCSIFSASFNSKEINRITFAMIGSVRNKPEFFSHFKYVIIDECHGVNSKNDESMYNKFLNGLDCRVLGLTATPYRLSTDGFGGSILKFITRTRPRIFSEMIYHVQIKELADQGFLAKMEYYQVDIVDPSKLQINSTGADYTDKSVQKHYSDIDFNKKLKEIIERLVKAGRKNILVFTRFVAEAQELSDYFNGLSDMVSGETPKKERERILNDFKSGEIRIVTNVGVLTTGFDFPELSTIVLARPTRSLALYYQMIGRAMRPHQSKTSAWIIDLCQTYKRFGNVESLEIRPEKPNTNLWAVFSNKNQLTNKYYE